MKRQAAKPKAGEVKGGKPAVEPKHRRTLAPLIQARIEEIHRDDMEMKKYILSQKTISPYHATYLRNIEARETNYLLEKGAREMALRDPTFSEDDWKFILRMLDVLPSEELVKLMARSKRRTLKG